uniref:BZIP domain-containing protein n=1 Tax=Kalanchoe fedtschenkoi TaxID=63787 RepID=A0A7N0V1W4_KALFE
MANAGAIDPPDPNAPIDDFTIPPTLDPLSFFADLGFDDEDGSFEFNLDDLSLPSDTESLRVDDFDFQVETIESALAAYDRFDFGIGPGSNSAISDDPAVVNAFGNGNVSGSNVSDGKGSNDSSSQEGNGPASSQGSKSSGVGSEAVNHSSPENMSSFDRDVWSKSAVDCEISGEVLGKRSLSKRNESGEGKIEPRISKLRKASANRDKCVSSGNEDEEKRKARMMRNRESAHHSRQRKKQYIEELEDKIRVMYSTITDLNNRISYVVAENTSLRQQLVGGGMYPPPPGMYPHMPYPWTPYPPYAIKNQGSKVPLVPIPRLKPRQPSKLKSNTKKVASISLLGLLFFIFLFGALVPLMNIRYEGTGAHIRNQHKDRIFAINGRRDGSDLMIAPASDGRLSNHANNPYHEKSRSGEKKDALIVESPRPPNLGNSTEPLLASLYVPRNDRLVRIDGNLIIHSVLASEKAVASYMNDEKLGTALVSHSSPGLTNSEVRSYRHRHPTETQKALGSGTMNTSPKHGEATMGEGKLQQWFQEGLAGPMLNSGMCTEVFQFEISPMVNPGAVVPASSVANRSAGPQYNSTHLRQIRNRRALNSLPIPDKRSTPNDTKGYMGKDSERDFLLGNKTPSSIVVSVLADPREVSDLENRIEPKTLSRIFVVVLLDSVKYVTYSCMLPVRGLGSHLVAS